MKLLFLPELINIVPVKILLGNTLDLELPPPLLPPPLLPTTPPATHGGPGGIPPVYSADS